MASDPPGLSSSSASRLSAGCACVRGGWAGAGGWKQSPGCGSRGGFSTFLYLCNQREEKFLWLFLRMVCSQDLEHLFHQQPFASFAGGTRDHNPRGLERQCQAALMALPAPLCPIPIVGQLVPLPLALPPCSSTRVSVPSSCLASLSPLQPCWCCSQAPLCPPVGPRLELPLIRELRLCASETTSEWGRKFSTRDPLGEETNFAVQSCPVPGWYHSCKCWFPLLSE